MGGRLLRQLSTLVPVDRCCDPEPSSELLGQTPKPPTVRRPSGMSRRSSRPNAPTRQARPVQLVRRFEPQPEHSAHAECVLQVERGCGRDRLVARMISLIACTGRPMRRASPDCDNARASSSSARVSPGGIAISGQTRLLAILTSPIPLRLAALRWFRIPQQRPHASNPAPTAPACGRVLSLRSAWSPPPR